MKSGDQHVCDKLSGLKKTIKILDGFYRNILIDLEVKRWGSLGQCSVELYYETVIVSFEVEQKTGSKVLLQKTVPYSDGAVELIHYSRHFCTPRPSPSGPGLRVVS